MLWSPPTYERLVGAWNLEKSEAVDAVQWLITKVIAAVENNQSPALTLTSFSPFPQIAVITPTINGQSTNRLTWQPARSWYREVTPLPNN